MSRIRRIFPPDDRVDCCLLFVYKPAFFFFSSLRKGAILSLLCQYKEIYFIKGLFFYLLLHSCKNIAYTLLCLSSSNWTALYVLQLCVNKSWPLSQHHCWNIISGFRRTRGILLIHLLLARDNVCNKATSRSPKGRGNTSVQISAKTRFSPWNN